MYCDSFGLRCNPFEDNADTQSFYATPQCEEILAALEHESRSGEGMALVLGATGTGKTLLARAFLRKLDAGDQGVVLTRAPGGEMDLIQEACRQFGAVLPSFYNRKRGLARLRRHLDDKGVTKHRPILIVDQAENLSAKDLSELSMMADLRKNDTKILTIILLADPHLHSFLERPEFAQIRQRLGTERMLSPLNPRETGQYIQHRLHVAGARNVDVFSEEAITLIHQASNGIPGLINGACDAAMRAAYELGQTRVGRDIVAEVTETTAPTAESIEAALIDAGIPGEVSAEPASAFAAETATEPRPTFYEPPAMASASLFGAGGEFSDTSYGAGVPAQKVAERAFTGGRIDEVSIAKMEDLLARGETLFQRLERTLARADRMDDTSEAKLLQATAVEKHLTSLTEHAEGAISGLTGSVRHASDSLGGIEERVRDILSQAEHRVKLMEAETSRLPETTNEVRKHIDSVEQACERADGVAANLTTFTEQLADKADAVQERIALLMSTLQTSEDFERSRHETNEAARSELNNILERVSSAVAQGEKTLQTLRTESQNVIDDTQRLTETALENHERKLKDRFGELDRTQHATIGAAQAELNATLERVSSVVAQSEKTLQTLRTESQNVIGDTQRLTETALENHERKLRDRFGELDRAQHETIEAAQAELNTILERVSSLAAQSEKTLETLQTKSQSVIDDTQRLAETALQNHEKGVEDRFEELARTQHETVETAERRLQNLREKVNGTIGACEQSQVALMKKAESETTQLEERVCQAESRRADLQLSVAALCERVDGAASSVSALKQASGHIQSVVQELNARADAANANITNSVERGEKLLLEAKTASGQIEALQRGVATSLVEIGGASERANALREQTERCEQIAGRLDSAQTQSAKVADELDTAVASASSMGDVFQSIMADAEGKIGLFDSHSSAAKQVLRELTEASLAGHAKTESLIETVKTSIQPARHVVEQLEQRLEKAERLADHMSEYCGQADELIERLASEQSRTAEIADRLDTTATAAGEMHEMVRNATVNAEERIGQLDSHNAAATHVLRELSDANVTGHTVVEKTGASVRAAEQTAQKATEQVDKLLQEVRELTARTEVTAETLANNRTDAESLIGKIDAAAKPAREVADELGQRAEEAGQLIDGVAERCGQAGEAVERLASVTQILENAQNIESSVRTTTGDARAVFDELAPLVEDAGNRSQTLQDLNRTAESLAQRNMHLKQESEQATEQIAAMQSSTEAGELLLAEFDRQTQSLAKQLGDLRLKAIQIEEAIAQAITKPTELAADARAQAAQLEQVCTAVRRVFGGLSKASLKAKQQTDDFNRASSEATERFARLTTETGRASSTLHEWIEEAVRVQGRLERSLQQAPSIRETHPSEALLTMSRTLEPAGRLAGPSAGGELQMLSEPETDTEPEKEPIAKPKTRAEEILQMIEDAKRTARVTP